MIRHTELGETEFARKRKLAELIRTDQISLGGNRPGKIYGQLKCRAGKRMKPENRVFFETHQKRFQPIIVPALCVYQKPINGGSVTYRPFVHPMFFR